MNRRDFLKALAAIPVGIALTRVCEAASGVLLEVWSGGRLCAVRQIGLSENWTTRELTLSESEVASIVDWRDVSVKLRAINGGTAEVAYLELDTPPPATWRVPPRSRHARKRDREWWEGRSAHVSQA